MKEESEKVGLKLNVQKTKIMASGPITSLQIHGETVDTVTDFIFLGSKITADGEIKSQFTAAMKLKDACSFVMTNLLLLISRFSHVRLCATPWTAANQASPSMGFSRQAHWSGFPFPSPMHESGK